MLWFIICSIIFASVDEFVPISSLSSQSTGTFDLLVHTNWSIYTFFSLQKSLIVLKHSKNGLLLSGLSITWEGPFLLVRSSMKTHSEENNSILTYHYLSFALQTTPCWLSLAACGCPSSPWTSPSQSYRVKLPILVAILTPLVQRTRGSWSSVLTRLLLRLSPLRPRSSSAVMRKISELACSPAQ